MECTQYTAGRKGSWGNGSLEEWRETLACKGLWIIKCKTSKSNVLLCNILSNIILVSNVVKWWWNGCRG